MTRYSVQLRERIFVKSYGLMPLDKNTGKNIGKNIRKNLSGNTARNFLIMPNNLQQKHLKLLQKDNSKNSRSNWTLYLR